MLKKIKDFIEKRKQLNKQKQYYDLVARGGLFLKFIYNDLEQIKNQQINRNVRRRFTKDLKNEGRFSKEMISYYANKVDSILLYIESQSIKNKIFKKKAGTK